MDTKSYVIKHFYDSYSEYVKDNQLYEIDYKTFRGIVTDYFKHIRDEVIENGREFKLPCRLGFLTVIKHKPKHYDSRSLRVDYRSSRDVGKLVLHLNEHTNGFKYRFHWNKQKMLIKNKIKYQLVMTRANKRRLAYILKNRERDYMEI